MMNPADNPPLTHVDDSGNVRMVDVSDKKITVRTAVASAVVSMKPDVLDRLVQGKLKKGESLAAAKLAGINAAKLTGQLIPLCHVLPIDWVDIAFTTTGQGRLEIRATARAEARTGVEMEAITAASVAALTIYDMAKAADRAIVIGPIQLESKTGGRRGPYQRTDGGSGKMQNPP